MAAYAAGAVDELLRDPARVQSLARSFRDYLARRAANARLHGEKNLAAIRASLAQFGQRKPIVVQRAGMIVRAGNGTLMAAKALGWTEIAAVVLDDDNATAMQFAIADNRSAELAEWDNETLATLLQGLDVDALNAVGFERKDLDALLRDLTPPLDDDLVPEPPVTPVSRLGDLWVLGDHRLLCGDSTAGDQVSRLLGRDAGWLDRQVPAVRGLDLPGAVGRRGHSWRRLFPHDWAAPIRAADRQYHGDGYRA